MIPTTYLRMFISTQSQPWSQPPRLQQLWAPLIGDETLFYQAEYLLEHGAEWRDIPLVIEPHK